MLSLTITAPSECTGDKVGVVELCEDIMPPDMVRSTKPLLVPPDAYACVYHEQSYRKNTRHALLTERT